MKFERALEPKELKILDKQLSQHNKSFKKSCRFLLIWTLLALIIGSYAYIKMKDKGDKTWLILTIIIYIGIAVWVVGEDFLKQRKQKRSIAFLRQKNVVTVVKVVSNKYYELTEENDEGIYYLFQLDGNKIFSFGGQDFYPSKKFPSDNFEIVEGRGFKNEVILLEIYNYGEKINPHLKISGQDKWNLLNSATYPDPYKLTMIDAKLEDIFKAESFRQS